MRIALIVGSYPPAERKRRVDIIRSYSVPGMDVDVVDVLPSPYVPGFGSDGAASAVPEFAAACREAERRGFDAVIPLGVLDIGLEEGRAAVGIPVVGAFEAAISLASFLGRRIGVIAYSSDLLPVLEALAHRYGVHSRICAFDDVGVPLHLLESSRDRLEDKFCAAADRLISGHDADVIVSAGISLCPVHIDKATLESRLGRPVVEAIGAPIQIAHALVRLDLHGRPGTGRVDPRPPS